MNLRNADLFNKFGEESTNDQTTCISFVDAAAHQVEELFIIKASGCGCMSSTDDFTVLDFEVRNGVGLRSFTQHKVTVELVGIGSIGSFTDQAVPNPH